MNRISRLLHLCGGFALAMIALVAATGPVSAKEERNYILSTGTTGATFYPVGVAIATLCKVKLEPKSGIAMSAISSAGSGENIKLMREKQAPFAILQGLYGKWAWKGEGKLKNDGAQKYMRSITMLWPNVEHFAIRSKFVKNGTVDDLSNLKGKSFSIGKKNSGAAGSGETILTNLGIDPDKNFNLVHLGFGPSADALVNGTVDGVNMPGGPPTGAMTRAYATMGDDITILNFTDDQLAKVNGEDELWTRYVIKADTYPGQKKDINSIAQPNLLAVHKDVPEEDVYQITKTIYENLAFLHNIHKATMGMAIEKAIAGLPMPLHPGALRYFKEKGLTIPERLVAK